MQPTQLTHMWLRINGADRMFICDPEKDTLAEVLRRIGLTGVKVGCGTGVCGACSVLLDGEVIRSCTRKMKSVKDYSEVLTIEGIGTPLHPHPLQIAFLTYGAVQCGFCSPGFIVSAYGLLQKNPSPTREEVRDWFTKHRNVCRCTGYVQITDAVMAAARVMRGEATMDDITYKAPADGKVYGGRLPRPNALAKVCGTCDYGEDIAAKMPEGMLQLAVVMPRVYHHARILRIDYSEAEKMPGVVKVITAKDVQGTNREMIFFTHPRCTAKGPDRPLICDKVIRRWGDIVAVVAADTREHARAAAAAVKVELEPLPEYTTFPEAAMPGAMEIHEGVADNTYVKQPCVKGDYMRAGEIIDESAYSVGGSFYSGSEAHLTIETDVAQAYWGVDGMLTVHCKAQAVEGIRQAMAKGIGIDISKLRLIENPTGASFGYAVVCCLYALPCIVTMATGRPSSLALSYDEHMHFSGKRAASYSNARVGCGKDGKLTAVEYDFAIDHGAYGRGGDKLVTRPTRFMMFPYYIPNAIGMSRMGYSNFSYGTAYRGYGVVQTMTASETLMDMLAYKAGVDPFEFRCRNLAREGQTTINNRPYQDYVMEDMMDRARPYYEKAVARAKAEDTPEVRRGVGVALAGFNATTGKFDRAEVALELNEDGTVTHYNTWEAQGQGADVGTVMHTCEALRELGITPEQVRLVQNDSKLCPNTGVAAGSRSHFMAGNATIDAANKLLTAMRKEDGSFRTYAEMAAEGIPTKYIGHYENTVIPGIDKENDPNTGEGNPCAILLYVVFIAEVAVDVKTGKTKVVGMTCVNDIGEVGNELAVLGQAYSGMSHSIGFALTEDYRDMKRHTNIAACGVPTANDIPDNMTVIHMKHPRAIGPFGSAGCSEAFQSSGHVAVMNAVYNATGVRITETPASAAKVKAGLEALARGEQPAQPKPYYLGGDLYEEIEEMQENPVKG